MSCAPNVSVDVGYFRTWSGNFTVTDNTLVTPADYDPFCITLPLDPRLPGGGGNQLCDLGDIKPAKFGLVDNVVTQASHFGKQERVFDGVDAKLTARVRGALITGGWNIGRQRLNCVVVDAPVQFCDNRPPFQSDFKLGLSYELPYDIRVSHGDSEHSRGAQVFQRRADGVPHLLCGDRCRDCPRPSVGICPRAAP